MKRKFAVIISLLCVCIVSFPYWFALLHIWKLKKDLNNPIIDSGFQGWHSVLLDENIEIKLPDTWSLEAGERLVISDSNGMPVAFGIKENPIERGSERWLSLLSDCAGYTVTSYTPEFFCGDRFGNLASVRWMVCTSDTGLEEKVTSVSLPYNHQYIYYFCFIGDAESYCNTAEAIAWSMSYTDE